MSLLQEVVNMRVLVTGATGFIGSRLIPELSAKGIIVRALTRNAARYGAGNNQFLHVSS